jgi:hypothetical protein
MRKSWAPIGLGGVLVGLCAWGLAGGQERLPPPKAYFDVAAVRAQLKLELRMLQHDGLGPDHPKVKAAKSQLEALDEITREELKIQLVKLRQELGPDHPRVKDAKELLDLVGGEPAQEPAARGGRYAVAASSQNVILLDTMSGQTWYLRAGKAGEDPAWVAVKSKE